ncbi:MAG: hypothetical protein H6698_01170 [Myxococcales bacterium]|nr:hypothetical protein [Myxococcales bacterium]MCB9532922.1 hypothetical protein [Myxococcales bacterium]
MTHRRGAALVAPALAAALGLVAGAVAPACHRETPDEVLTAADQAIEAGDPASAIRLLEARDLVDDPVGGRLVAEASILTGDFDRAIQLLSARAPRASEDETILEDACAMGALAALETGDTPVATLRVDACAGSSRLDLVAIRLRLGPSPSSDQIDAALAALAAAEPGPETDVAAEQLEAGLVAFADAASDDIAAIDLLLAAFRVAHDPELGARVVAATLTAADARRESSPTVAASLYQRIAVSADGIAPTDEQRAEAQQRAKDALLPLFATNFRARYRERFESADVEARRYDPATDAFTFPSVAQDPDHAALHAWLYERLERPRPTPTPDFVAWSGLCTEATEPCTIPFEQLARWAYYAVDIQTEYAAEHEVTYTWPQPE